MAETTIRPALPAQELAIPLISEHHEHLEEARILWLFTTSKRTRGGHVVLGSSSRSNPLQRFLSSGNESVQTGFDYIVLIDDGRWKRALKTQQLALIDHLLCCMVQREVVNTRSGEITRTWATVGPDINEFIGVIERHGVYLPAQQQFAQAFRAQGNTLRLKFPDLDADDVAQEISEENHKAERETTVDGDGTVVATRRTRGRPPRKTLPEPEDRDAPKSSPDANLSDAETGGANQEQTTANGVDAAPTGQQSDDPDGSAGSDWRRDVGIGQGELAAHRAARRQMSEAGVNS